MVLCIIEKPVSGQAEPLIERWHFGAAGRTVWHYDGPRLATVEEFVASVDSRERVYGWLRWRDFLTGVA